MNKPTHILLLDEKAETRRSLNFLLKLSGHKLTIFPNREDAANWLSNAQKIPQHFDLLLINYLEIKAQENNLTQLLSFLPSCARVLMLSRETTEKHTTKHTACFTKNENYSTCSPEELLGTINFILNTSSQPFATVNQEN